MDQNELYHHGIKNQKWGERRYQYADGSLTSAGKKRYGTKTNYEKVLKAKGLKAKVKAQKEREKQNARTEAEVAKYKKRAGVKEEKETTDVSKTKTAKTKPHVKTISEMSNEEIQERIDRINLENKLKALTPHQKTRGEKIIDGIKDMTMDTIKKKVVPDLTDIVIKKLKEKLGIKDNSSGLERLADAAKRAGYEKQIAEAEMAKRKNDREKGQNNQHDQNQNDDGNNTRNEESNDSNDSGENTSRQNDQQNNGPERYTGTVEGEGTSRRNPYESRNNNSTRRQYTDDDAVDAEYRDLVDDDHRIEQQNSGPPATNRRRRLRHSEIGEEFVDGLLKDDELCHYGVVGMKWGVRRGVKELNRAYSDGGVYRGQHNHAVSKLSGHRDKINKKISKLEKKRVSIDNAIYKNETKIAPKVAKLHQKASKLTVKADRTSNYNRYEKLHRKANILEYKVSKLESTATKAKAKLAKNQKIQEEFKKGLSTIQKEMIDKGRDFLYMRSNGIPYTNGDIDEWTPLKKVKE